MPHPEAYFLADDGCTAERAALLAHRVRTAVRSARVELSADAYDHPFAAVATPGVPVAEAPALAALSVLALQVADELAGPVPADAMRIVCAARPSDDAGAWAALLATRLDRPESLERETRQVLGAVAAALIDDHPGLADWIPRHRDPTVRLRTPARAPGIPLVFVPFAVRTEEARHAIAHGDLLERALARCTPIDFAPGPAHTH